MSFQRLVREKVYIKELVLGNLVIVPPGEISGFVVENKGDLITSEDGVVLTNIARGLDGQVLQANSLSDVGMAWTTVSPAPFVLSVNGETGFVIFTIDDVNVMTNKGDIMVDQGGPLVVRLGVGADGQFLIADSTTATGIKWSNDAPFDIISVNGKTGAVVLTMNDVTPAINKGDLITVDDTNTTQRLPVGLNGQYLTSDIDTLPGVNPLGVKWTDRPPFDVSSVNGKANGTVIITIDDVSPATAKGDLITANAGNVATPLPVGASGESLTADSTDSLGLIYTPTPDLGLRTTNNVAHTYPTDIVNLPNGNSFKFLNYGTGNNGTTGFNGYYISPNFPVTTVGPDQGRFFASTEGWYHLSLYMNVLIGNQIVIDGTVSGITLNILRNGIAYESLQFIDDLSNYAKLAVNSISVYLLKNEYLEIELANNSGSAAPSDVDYDPTGDSNSIAVFNIALI